MEKHPDVEYVMIDEKTLVTRVKEMAKNLDTVYAGKTPVMICILKGSVLFFSDLVREMKGSVMLDFMGVSSYGSGTSSSGDIKITKELSIDIEGKDVVIVEDIVDSGNTLYCLKERLLSRKPASLRIVTLLDKPQRRVAPLQPEDTGFVIEDEFVVGYGLDYAEEYRNLPYVGVLKREVYEK